MTSLHSGVCAIPETLLYRSLSGLSGGIFIVILPGPQSHKTVTEYVFADLHDGLHCMSVSNTFIQGQ